LAGGLIAVVAVVASRLCSRLEPLYNGQTLSTWLRTYRGDVGWRRDEAFIAVRQIGTNAIPFLLSDLQYEVPAWKVRIWTSVAWSLARGPIVVRNRWYKLEPENKRRPLALAGFEILGPYASPAIPELLGQMEQQSTQQGCFWALSCIGQEAIAALLEVATNAATPVERRACAVAALGAMGTKASNCVPVLISCMDGENKLATSAAVALGSVATDSESAQKALIRMMLSSDPSLRAGGIQGLRNLWLRNRSAQAVVEPLRASLSDTSVEVRLAATNVTNEIRPSAPEIFK